MKITWKTKRGKTVGLHIGKTKYKKDISLNIIDDDITIPAAIFHSPLHAKRIKQLLKKILNRPRFIF